MQRLMWAGILCACLLPGQTVDFAKQEIETVKVADGKILLNKDGDPRDFALGDGETAIDAALGARDRLWVIVRSTSGVEVRAYTLEGEFLRRQWN